MFTIANIDRELAQLEIALVILMLSVTDLKLPLPFALTWRKDNDSPLLARLVENVRRLPEVGGFAKK